MYEIRASCIFMTTAHSYWLCGMENDKWERCARRSPHPFITAQRLSSPTTWHCVNKSWESETRAPLKRSNACIFRNFAPDNVFRDTFEAEGCWNSIFWQSFPVFRPTGLATRPFILLAHFFCTSIDSQLASGVWTKNRSVRQCRNF